MTVGQQIAREWSSQQQDIFTEFKDGRSNLVIRARAGTGKTTTIIEAISYAPEEKILLAAFNKKIAEELKTKLKNPKAEAKTLHSLGFGFVRRNWPGVRLDNERADKLARQAAGLQSPDPMVTLVKKLAALGKNAAPFPRLEQMVDLAYSHDLDPDEEWVEDGWTVQRIAECAMRAMDLAAQKDGTIDFDDMVFLPVRNGWVRPYFNLVVIDEAQDMNATQLLLATKSCKKGGRVVVVGDDRQAIYGFRGADANSLDRLKGELVAKELGLTTTYRCPKTVVAAAQALVPDYTAAPTAPEGQMLEMKGPEMMAAAGPGDFILSRKNAPLASICLKLLVMGKRAMIEGRDIGQGLVSLVNRLAKGKARNSIPEFIAKLENWGQQQTVRLLATGKASAESKVEYVRDQVETLKALAQGVTGIPELTTRVTSMFQDTNGNKLEMVVCSSVHKSKGLERDRVFGLVETLYPGGKRDKIEEQNIEYVMLTRAKKTFVSVTGIEEEK